MTQIATKIRVVLADDHAMVRESLAQTLTDSEKIEVVGVAKDGNEAITLTGELSPNVIILDYSMPELDGHAAAEKIRNIYPETKTIILTFHDNIHYAVKSLESGANGFVLKNAAVKELVSAIEKVHCGETYISSEVHQKMLQHWSGRKDNKKGPVNLSKREFELLRLMGRGIRLKECAQKMNVTESTVSTYRSRILEKLNLNSSAEIIRYAIENNIVG